MTVGNQNSGIPDWAKDKFSEDDLKKISNAIKKTEQNTSGELAVVVAQASFPWFFKSLSWFRYLVPKNYLIEAVHQRAELEFYRQKVHQTKDGVGVLIFLSLFERRAVVLADHGIHESLPHDDYDRLVSILIQGAKSKNFAQGLTEAIFESGKILEKFSPAQSENANELSDMVRFIEA